MTGSKIVVRGHKDYQDDFYRNEGKECEIIFLDKTKLLSDKQRQYYRGVVVKMIAERAGSILYEQSSIGYEMCHQDLAKKFLTFEATRGQEKRNYVRSTTTLNRLEMVDYIEQCRAMARDSMDLTIPDPDPNYYGENILRKSK